MVFIFQHTFLDGARSLRIFAAQAFTFVLGGGRGIALALLEGGEEALARKPSVHCLRTGVLHGHADVRGQMAQGDARGNFVDVLPAWPGGAAEGFFQLAFV